MREETTIVYVGPHDAVEIAATGQVATRGEPVTVASDLAGHPPELDVDGNLTFDPEKTLELLNEDGDVIGVTLGAPTDPGSGLLAQPAAWQPAPAKAPRTKPDPEPIPTEGGE